MYTYYLTHHPYLLIISFYHANGCALFYMWRRTRKQTSLFYE